MTGTEIVLLNSSIQAANRIFGEINSSTLNLVLMIKKKGKKDIDTSIQFWRETF